MAKKKTKSAFFCQNCGAQSPKWLGRCTTCKEWDTFVEENISTETSGVSSKGIFKKHKPILINDIS